MKQPKANIVALPTSALGSYNHHPPVITIMEMDVKTTAD